MILLLKSVQAGALAAALLVSPIVWAQKADSSPAKKDLIARILKQQQPAVEQLTMSLLSRPINQLAQSAAPMLGNLPQDKREATAKSIDASLRKFMDDNGPALVQAGQKLLPSTMGVILDEKFTEDELKELLKWLESPVSKKFGEVAPELQQAYSNKLMADNAAQLDPKLAALKDSVGKQLGLDANGSPAPAASKPAAKGPVKK